MYPVHAKIYVDRRVNIHSRFLEIYFTMSGYQMQNRFSNIRNYNDPRLQNTLFLQRTIYAMKKFANKQWLGLVFLSNAN